MDNLKIKHDSAPVTAEQKFVFPMAPARRRQPFSIQLPRLDQRFVTGFVQTSIGKVPRVSSGLTINDQWGNIKARWGIGRMNYTVEPGLYALGEPDTSKNIYCQGTACPGSC